MTKEIVHEVRIYCDGCGYAVVGSAVDYIDRAFEQCGWLHTTTQHGAEMDYCPVCRADSPFEAVQRVRELCDESDQNRPRIDGYLINRTVPVKDIRRALEGDNDE